MSKLPKNRLKKTRRRFLSASLEFLLVGLGALCLGIFSVILFLNSVTSENAPRTTTKKGTSGVVLTPSDKTASETAEAKRIDRVIGKILQGKSEPPDLDEVTATSSLRLVRPIDSSFQAFAAKADKSAAIETTTSFIGPPHLASSGGKEVIESMFSDSGEETIERQARYSGKEVIESSFHLSGKGVLEPVGNGGSGANGGSYDPIGSGSLDTQELLGAASEAGEKRLLPYVPIAAGGGLAAGTSSAASGGSFNSAPDNSLGGTDGIGSVNSGSGSNGIASSGGGISDSSLSLPASDPGLPSVTVGPPSTPMPRPVTPILPSVVPPVAAGGAVAGITAGGGVPPVPSVPGSNSSAGSSTGTNPSSVALPPVAPPIPAGGAAGVAPVIGGVAPPTPGFPGGGGSSPGSPSNPSTPPPSATTYNPPTNSNSQPYSPRNDGGASSSSSNTDGSGNGGGIPPVVPLIPPGAVAGGGGAGAPAPGPGAPIGGPQDNGGESAEEDSHDYPGQCIPWVVQPGQTIESLAAASGSTPAEVLKINKTSSIRPGQMIKLPAAFLVPCCE